MTFTVLWQTEAEDELAEIWLKAPDQAAVSRAADKLEELLHSDPWTESRPRRGAFRIKYLPPLGIQYQIREADCQVLVVKVWRTHRPFEGN
jgi:hypothetical protein